MHSSRMRTGRSLTICWCLLPGGVSAWSGGWVSGHGGLWFWGVSAWSGGVCLSGGVGSLVPGGCLPGLGGSAWFGGG